MNHYILHQEGNMVELWYLDTFSKIIGLDSETQMNSLGAIHKYTRSTLLKVFGAETLKQKLLPEIEDLVKETLVSWSSHESSVEVRHSLLVVSPYTKHKPKKKALIVCDLLTFLKLFSFSFCRLSPVHFPLFFFPSKNELIDKHFNKNYKRT